MEVVQALLDAGINVNAKNVQGNTALHCAANSGNMEIVQVLLNAGINENAKNDQGNTALHLAANKPGIDANAGNKIKAMLRNAKSVKVAQGLLARGIDINAKNNQGRTALHLATSRENAIMVRTLLAVPGVDVNAKNNKGETVFCILKRFSKM